MNTPKLSAAIEAAINSAKEYRAEALRRGLPPGLWREEALALALKEMLAALEQMPCICQHAYATITCGGAATKIRGERTWECARCAAIARAEERFSG